LEITNTFGKRSRNFFRPPNFSFSFCDRLPIEVVSASNFPISPTGRGPFTARISVDSVSSAGSDRTDSSMRLQYMMCAFRCSADE
jgi:hypothetical protein